MKRGDVVAESVSVDIKGHGLYTCTSDVLDKMIEEHLPSSARELRALVEQRTEAAWGSVTDVSSFLIVLGDFEMGHIRARRVTGNDSQQQKEIARAIKNAREMALLPYANRVTTQRGGGRDRGDRGDRGRADGPPPRPDSPPPGSGAEAEAEVDVGDGGD